MCSSGLLKWTCAVSLATVAFFSASASGKVWYVDDDNFNTPGTDGLTEATAFGTIQEAVNAASSEDIVMVAAGTYDQGSTPDGFTKSMANRVYIDKPLTLCGADKDTTIIKGKLASIAEDSFGLGLGQDAVRCIGVNASGVKISNFTITGGATHMSAESDDTDGNGGGIYAKNGLTDIVVVDCVISNNIANRAGAARYGNDSTHNMVFVRSWFHWNRAVDRDPVTRGCMLAHCLITKHPCQKSLMYNGTLVNCTFAGNRMRAAGEKAAFKAYNCLFADTWYRQSYTDPYYANCAFPIPRNEVTVEESINEFCQFDVGYDHFVAPVFNDYRIHDNAVYVIGKGDAQYLDLIPEEYRNIDFYGEVFSKDGAINIGCCQKSVEPTGGIVRFAGMPNGEAKGTYGFTSDPDNKFFFGEDSTSFFFAKDLAYARAVSNRTILNVRAELSAWKGLYGFQAEGSDTVMRYPLMDGTYKIMIPPKGKTLTLSPVEAKSVFYVDKNSGETVEDGSADFPFKSIQPAVDAVLRGTYAVVYVKEGVYDNGAGIKAKDHLNRVAISDKYVRLVSADGVGKATIAGAPNPGSALDSWPFGCGEKAMRCVYAGAFSAVQGFTLSGGRCNNPGTGNASYGGAAYLGTGAQLLDCILTNNIAAQGSAVFGDASGKKPVAYVQRCMIAGNFAIDAVNSLDKKSQKGSGVCRRVTLASCIFYDNWGQGFGSYEYAYTYHCTMLGPGYNASAPTFITSPVTNINCVIVSPYDHANRPMCIGGTAAVGFGEISPNSVGTVREDAMLANPAEGDFRLSAMSPARNAAVVGFDGFDSDPNHSQYYIFGAVDFYGKEFVLNDAGLPVCGAVSLFAPTFIADEKEVALSNPTVTDDGIFKVTCTALSASTRPFLGMSVNNVTQETVSAVCEFSVENSGNHPVPYSVKALYDTNWFVDATNGVDSGWGTASSPKATLKGALQYALPGDKVFVAPGVYDSAVMYVGGELASSDQNSDFDLGARAVVTNDVSLIGSGADCTFIVGEADPNAPEENYGCGGNAVRCAVLYPRASLRGFTVTGGRTKSVTADNKGDALCGGGILASRCSRATPSSLYSELPRIEDCVISNCVARRGGGAYNGVYNRCWFIDNRILNGGNGAAARATAKNYLYCRNTVFDFNDGFSTTFFATLENCTIGAGNAQNGLVDSLSVVNNSPLVINTLILGNKGCAATSGSILSNCVFNSNTYNNFAKNEYVIIGEDCRVAPSDDQLLIDKNYAPVIGANIAVDAGKESLSTEDLGLCDVFGNPRKVNGLRLDVGAVEADWKAEYSRRLGRRVNVTVASPEVLSDDSVEGVLIPAGATLAATYGRAGTSGERTTIGSTVAAGGSLTVDTATWKRTIAGGENQILAFKTDADFTDFEFSAVDADAVLHGIVRAIPFSVIIR